MDTPRRAPDAHDLAELLTVIVPTRDEEGNVPAFVASLPSWVKLIVVDASVDETPRLLRAIRPWNTSIIRDGAGIAAARDIGARAARTPWLLFTDVDVVFDADFFGRLAQRITADDHDAWYGPKRSRDRFVAYYDRFSRGQGLCHRLGIPAVSGSNLAVRRTAYHAVGGFDLDLSCNEDSELGWRLRRAGSRIGFDPHMVVYARDHRRIARARWPKTLHTAVRCALLYADLLPRRWRRSDWGYWTRSRP